MTHTEIASTRRAQALDAVPTQSRSGSPPLPVGLWILLGVFAVLGVTIAYVLHLAAAMPS